ncbi:MAG: hypothetical protein ACREL1_05250 [bacterium]
MPLEPLGSSPVDALGQMSKAIYDEYKALGFTGLSLDPARYLAFRKLSKNGLFSRFIISDAGAFFIDPLRKIKYKFHSQYFLVYHDGLSPAEEEKLRQDKSITVKLDNGLEFWRREGFGYFLIYDHAHTCDYLAPNQKVDLERVKKLYSPAELVLRPMSTGKTRETSTQPHVIDLDE